MEGLAELISDFFNSIDPKQTFLHRSKLTRAAHSITSSASASNFAGTSGMFGRRAKKRIRMV